ncbi:Transposable element Tcb2 transposase [Chionoecetes opilio]|uniref:Transposable element Tcb2 transposase n=1 Tax=Chionoecetes opilio TaxID=41210 RepID=A0A8J4YCJ6_CHIOP|nr:Transposable element Tcb2 transposase [Chionoecetes opilio]
MEDRMEYALEYADKPDNFWERVLYCDEKNVPNRWSVSNNIMFGDVNNTRSGVSPLGCVVGCTPVESGSWLMLDRDVDMAKVCSTLEEVLLPSVQELLFPEGEPFYLLQDNSPVHTCRVVQQWFARHPYITLLPHPANSPDLNPIEHVWSAMLKHMDDQERPRNVLWL